MIFENFAKIRKINLQNAQSAFATLHSLTMPSLKLTYFDLKGRAEPIRIILEVSGIGYEDERIPAPWDDQEKWFKLKPSTPFGQLPILSVDGEVISQSIAIARYCAHEFGLAGKNTLENGKMDEIVEAVKDGTEKQIEAFLFEQDETRKTDLQEKFHEEVLPKILQNLEKRLVSRGKKYFVGGKLSWADIFVFNFCSELPEKNVVDAYPNLADLVNRLGNVPSIRAWIEVRPDTLF